MPIWRFPGPFSINSWRICVTPRRVAHVFQDELMFPIGDWIKKGLLSIFATICTISSNCLSELTFLYGEVRSTSGHNCFVPFHID
jgi:hypothetical protein